ncbi:MAG: BadF/BadG/BcrA/BcrD ATPase family protein, partial [Aggregatilineales bacterium]
NHHLAQKIVIVNDAISALRAGSPDGTGVVVVCGTGTGTGARTADGRTWTMGWWQQTGGSRQLGKSMLRAVFAATLGIGPATTLTERTLEFFGLPDVEAVLHFLTSRDRNKTIDYHGKLARVVLEEAKGDSVAYEIVCAHGASLGDHAVAAARRLGLEGRPFYLVLAGGVLKARPPLFVDALVNRVRATSPDIKPVFSQFEPVVGALFLALESIGVPVTESLIAHMIPTLPPPALFDT